MHDIDGPEVSKTYSELFRDSNARLDADVIPYALDAAAQKLRKSGASAARWATYVHIGI
jgi:hypothetical protein